MAREVRLSLRLDGVKKGEGEVLGLRSVFDQLEETASRDIKQIQRTLDSVDTDQLQSALKQINDGSIDNTISDAETLKKVLDNVDDDQLKEAKNTIKEVGTEAQQAATIYRDASGRMRDENGKFIKSANDAEKATKAWGGAVENAAKQFDKLKNSGASIKNFGSDVQNFGQQLTVGVTLPIIAFGVAAVKTFADVESAVAEISTIKPQIDTRQVFDALTEMEKRVPQTAAELGAGLYNIFSSIEIGQADALVLLEGFAKGATAAKTDAETFGTAVLGVMNAYKMSVERKPSNQAKRLIRRFVNKILIKERFAGTMDDLSQTLSGRFSTLMDKGKAFFRELFLPAFEYAKPAIDFVVSKLEFLTSYLQTLSPQTKLLIVGVLGAVAAFAPFLVILGTVISFVGSVVGSIGALIPIFAAVGGAIVSLGGFVVSFIGLIGSAGLFASFSALASVTVGVVVPAIGAFLSAIAPVAVGIVAVGAAVVAVVGTLIAATAALVLAWQNDFGGIKTYTLQLWEVVKNTFQVGMSYAYSVVQTVGGQIVGWWRENYPLIKQIVVSVSDSIKSTIGAFLYAVRGFWENHGAAISSYVSTYWGYIKSIVSQVITEISNVIRLGLQLISGDFSGAWQTVLKIIQDGSRLWATVTKAGLDLLIKFLYAAIPIVVEFGIKFQTTLGTWIGKAIVGAAYVVATLPQQIGKLIPAMVRAGISIGAAIWEGIKQGLFGGGEAAGEIRGELKNGLLAGFSPDGTVSAGENFAGLSGSVNPATQTAASLNVGQLKADADSMKKNREALAKSELAAQIGLYSYQAEQIKKIYDSSFDTITEKFKETNNPTQFEGDWQTLKQWYGEQINELAPMWDDLARQQILSEKKGQYERELAYKEHQDKLQQLGQITLDKDTEVQKLITANAKKADDERTKNAEDYAKKVQDAKNSLLSSGLGDRFGISEQTKSLQMQIDLGRELSDVETQQIKNQIELVKYETELRNAKFNPDDITKLSAILKIEQDKTLELLKQLGITKEQIAADKLSADAKNYGKDLDSQLASLQGRNREMSKYDEVLQKLNSDYKNLDVSEQKRLLNIAAQVDAQNKFNDQYEKTHDFIRDSLDILTDETLTIGERLKSFFGGIVQSLKKLFLDAAASFLTSKLFKFLNPNSSSGSSSSGSSGSSSGGGIFGVIQNLFGGGGANGSSSGGGLSITGLGGGNPHEALHSGGSSGFSSIFGEQGFGNNVGTYSALGSFAGIAGGLIGGRVGGFISGAGAGLGIGAQIGSMIMPGLGTALGAGIGAIAGGLMSLFGGDPKRKADKKQLPQLAKGFADAMAEFNQLIKDSDALRIKPPDSALTKAAELRNQIATGFGLNWQSKKYRQQSQQQINAQLALIDAQPGGLMAQLRASVARAKDADEFSNQFVATFAGGIYMDGGFRNQYDDFKRYNGMMPGAWTGKDHIRALIANSEMVLNPAQQMNVIRNAGGADVFAGAGIPNYKKTNTRQPARMATGAFVGTSATSNQSSGQPQMVFGGNIILQGFTPQPDAKAYYESPEGKRQIISVTREHVQNNPVSADGLARDLKKAER